MDRAYDASLDEALEQTFPASDPISMQQPVIAGGRNSLPSHQARGRPNLDQRNREMAKPTKRRAPRKRNTSAKRAASQRNQQ